MPYEGYTGSDPISQKLLSGLYDLTVAYRDIEGQLQAAKGDRSKALQTFMDSSDNPQAMKLRETIEKARKSLESLAEKNVVSVTLSEEETEKKETELSELKKRIKAGFSATASAAESLASDPELVKKALAEIEDPTKGSRGRPPGSGTGSGLPRASVLVTVNGGKYENKEFESFSQVAVALSAEVKDLQESYAKSAGVDPKDIKTVTDPQSFEFKAGDQVYLLSTKPKPRAKPGPKSAESEQKADAA